MSPVPPPPPPPPNNPKPIERGPSLSDEVAAWLGRCTGTIFGWVVALVFAWALWKVLAL